MKCFSSELPLQALRFECLVPLSKILTVALEDIKSARMPM